MKKLEVTHFLINYNSASITIIVFGDYNSQVLKSFFRCKAWLSMIIDCCSFPAYKHMNFGLTHLTHSIHGSLFSYHGRTILYSSLQKWLHTPVFTAGYFFFLAINIKVHFSAFLFIWPDSKLSNKTVLSGSSKHFLPINLIRTNIHHC